MAKSLKFRNDLTGTAAALHLEALARGLRDGKVLIESGDKSLTLEVSHELQLDFAAGQSDKGKAKVEITLSWRAPKAGEEEPTASLLISTGAAFEPPAEAPF
jgi:amphi-Trp domain-containing protein